MKTKVAVYVFVLIITLFSAVGYSIDSFSSGYNVAGNKVFVTTEIGFTEAFAEEFSFQLPSDASDIAVYMNNEQIDYTIEEGMVSVELKNAQELRIEYTSSEPIDKSGFLLDLVMPFAAADVKISLTLPQGYALKEPLSEDNTVGSIYPKPEQALTDGENLIFVWGRIDLEEGEELPIYVQYKKPRNPAEIIPIFVGLVLVILLLKNQPKKTKTTKHLKEDEETIVNILRQRDGRMCEQGTLRVITGMPKASLSRLLTELEERRVIYKEKRGKKNLIFLKE